jgi:hypothetical protein
LRRAHPLQASRASSDHDLKYKGRALTDHAGRGL